MGWVVGCKKIEEILMLVFKLGNTETYIAFFNMALNLKERSIRL